LLFTADSVVAPIGTPLYFAVLLSTAYDIVTAPCTCRPLSKLVAQIFVHASSELAALVRTTVAGELNSDEHFS